MQFLTRHGLSIRFNLAKSNYCNTKKKKGKIFFEEYPSKDAFLKPAPIASYIKIYLVWQKTDSKK
ncbi:hypothetical protein B6D52_00185 [Candidatus Parcubacteria bacterium 4484_255]|nr:MAG: hypothetical protein B6D52_00185 [Candidatus Parcubacteria bacterium 4484_255]